VTEKLAKALSQAVQNPDVQRKLLDLGVDPASEHAEAFPELYRSLVGQWRAIVEQSRVTVD
jgi:tripartite-type tricarboxylate transporter receptor subunit TctC